jgi:hypothetical protein
MPIMAHIHSDAEIEMIMTSLGREPGGGLVVMPDVFTSIHRALRTLRTITESSSADHASD